MKQSSREEQIINFFEKGVRKIFKDDNFFSQKIWRSAAQGKDELMKMMVKSFVNLPEVRSLISDKSATIGLVKEKLQGMMVSVLDDKKTQAAMEKFMKDAEGMDAFEAAELYMTSEIRTMVETKEKQALDRNTKAAALSPTAKIIAKAAAARTQKKAAEAASMAKAVEVKEAAIKTLTDHMKGMSGKPEEKRKLAEMMVADISAAVTKEFYSKGHSNAGKSRQEILDNGVKVAELVKAATGKVVDTDKKVKKDSMTVPGGRAKGTRVKVFGLNLTSFLKEYTGKNSDKKDTRKDFESSYRSQMSQVRNGAIAVATETVRMDKAKGEVVGLAFGKTKTPKQINHELDVVLESALRGAISVDGDLLAKFEGAKQQAQEARQSGDKYAEMGYGEFVAEQMHNVMSNGLGLVLTKEQSADFKEKFAKSFVGELDRRIANSDNFIKRAVKNLKDSVCKLINAITGTKVQREVKAIIKEAQKADKGTRGEMMSGLSGKDKDILAKIKKKAGKDFKSAMSGAAKLHDKLAVVAEASIDSIKGITQNPKMLNALATQMQGMVMDALKKEGLEIAWGQKEQQAFKQEFVGMVKIMDASRKVGFKDLEKGTLQAVQKHARYSDKAAASKFFKDVMNQTRARHEPVKQTGALRA